MSTRRSGTCGRIRRSSVVLSCVAALVWMAGCKTPPKDEPAAADNTRGNNEVQPVQRAPKTANNESARVAAAPAQSEATNEAEKPDAKPKPEKVTRAKPEQKQPPTSDQKTAKGDQPKTIAEMLAENPSAAEIDQDALAELIRLEAMTLRKGQGTEQPKAAPAAPAEKAPTAKNTEEKKPAKPTVSPVERPAKPERKGTDAQKPAVKEKGCGSKGGPKGALTPPPPDAPQPKFACATKKSVIENIWRGEKANFEWEIKNEGEGPLQIRIRKG